MMARILLIGLGSGLVSALLFASLVSGSPLAILLFYLSSLPIFIVGLGWPHWSALVASLAGATVLTVMVSSTLGVFFLLGVGLPAWWLSYLALLASANERGEIDWYPLGRLVLWAAAISAALTAASLPMITGSVDDYESGFRAALEQVLRAQTDTADGEAIQLPNGGDPARFLDVMAMLLPPLAALTSMISLLFNLWAGARIVQKSKRLPRPWPDIAGSLVLPRGTAAGMGVMLLGGWLLPGIAGLFAELGAVTLLACFMLLGFAVLHVVTRGMPGRLLILSAAYLLVLLQAWLLFVAALGFAEQLLGVRARVAARRAGRLPPTKPRT
jgi:hypothetical protein